MEMATKKSDRQEGSPFEGLQKGVVMHEVRIFSEPQISPRNCCKVLTKILYLLCQGETFTSDEATSVFFGTTKLFQSQNATLRRMVYLVIKELARDQDNVFVVINCLSKDMTSNNDVFRSNAIRVFAKVIDASMLGTMDRFLKQAIVDRNPAVSSAALIAGQQLFRIAPDVIRRWQNEIQEAVNSKSKMVQYHAFALLCLIKQHDRLALSKIVSGLARRPPRSPLAHCLLIRYITKLVRVDPDQSMIDFLMSCVRNKSPMVAFEAIRGICNLPNAARHQIQGAISAVQQFLGSSQPTERFAAVRVLSSVVAQHPAFVAPCSTDLEMLIQDQNRSIATLAVTTLLKTGVESNVERLMKSISSFMAEITDELRIVLVEALRSLCLKFPHKHSTLMAFLSSVLREEGGVEYKTTIVKTILTLMNEIDDAKEPGLEHLCEFIEDCEFPKLSVQILHVLGEEGPKTSCPARYIRFIFNRVILETPSVRAAAVQSLAKFGAACPKLTDSCMVLLKRSLRDNDDEVRDRAIYCIGLLQTSHQSELLRVENISWTDLEQSLTAYLSQPGYHNRPFSLDDVVHAAVPTPAAAPEAGAAAHVGADFGAQPGAPGTIAYSVAEAVNPYLEQLNSIPEFAALGTLFKASRPVELTESEAEYVTSYVKLVFENHVLLQFTITNHMEGQVLVNVSVDLNVDWAEEMSVSAPLIPFEGSGAVWVCLQRPEQVYSCPSTIPATLKFSVRDAEADPDEEGYEDEYELEDLSIGVNDFIAPNDKFISLAEFRGLWDASTPADEFLKRLNLTVPTIQDAVDAVLQTLSLSPVEGSNVVAHDASTHTVNTIGKFITGETILARAGFMAPSDKSKGIALKVAIRSPSLSLSQTVGDLIQ